MNFSANVNYINGVSSKGAVKISYETKQVFGLSLTITSKSGYNLLGSVE